jgi:hypothetical protein
MYTERSLKDTMEDPEIRFCRSLTAPKLLSLRGVLLANHGGKSKYDLGRNLSTKEKYLAVLYYFLRIPNSPGTFFS